MPRDVNAQIEPVISILEIPLMRLPVNARIVLQLELPLPTSRIGLLSDSHGQAARTRRAVQMLDDLQVDLLIHLGDICSTDVIDALVVQDPKTGEQMPAHLVFGNNDMDLRSMGSHATHLGLTNHHPVGSIQTSAGELVFMHGDDSRALQRAVERGARFVCHGHTHQRTNLLVGPTRIINPGALYRANDFSIAVLEPENEGVKFYSVKDR